MGGIGYNVFVTGLAGTGRLTTISRFLDQLASGREPPDDLCYVDNFRSPEEPRLCLLTPGPAGASSEPSTCLVRELAEHLPGILADQELPPPPRAGCRGTCSGENGSWSRHSRGGPGGRVFAGPDPGRRRSPARILPVVGDRPVAHGGAALAGGGVPSTTERAARLARSSHSRLAERLRGLSSRRRAAAPRPSSGSRSLAARDRDPTSARRRGRPGQAAVDDPRAEPLPRALREDLTSSTPGPVRRAGAASRSRAGPVPALAGQPGGRQRGAAGPARRAGDRADAAPTCSAPSSGPSPPPGEGTTTVHAHPRRLAAARQRRLSGAQRRRPPG